MKSLSPPFRSQPVSLLTLYARREPALTHEFSVDVARRVFPPKATDVMLYRDVQATQRVARYPWHLRSVPTRRNRYVMHNCWRYALVWLQDLAPAAAAVAPSSMA